MARPHHTSTRPRDRVWLNDALDRNRALEEAFYRIARNDQEARERLRLACLWFLFVYENFSKHRTLARAELRRQQEQIDVLGE
jgi:hypothetical protein